MIISQIKSISSFFLPLLKALIAISLPITIGTADNNALITPLTLMTHQTLFLALGRLILQRNASKLVKMEHNSFVDQKYKPGHKKVTIMISIDTGNAKQTTTQIV